jgi:hypothetical protein
MRRLPIGALALGQPYPPRGPGRWTAFWLPQLLTQSAISSHPIGQKFASPLTGLKVQPTYADGHSKMLILQSGRTRFRRAGRHLMNALRQQFERQNWRCRREPGIRVLIFDSRRAVVGWSCHVHPTEVGHALPGEAPWRRPIRAARAAQGWKLGRSSAPARWRKTIGRRCMLSISVDCPAMISPASWCVAGSWPWCR